MERPSYIMQWRASVWKRWSGFTFFLEIKLWLTLTKWVMFIVLISALHCLFVVYSKFPFDTLTNIVASDAVVMLAMVQWWLVIIAQFDIRFCCFLEFQEWANCWMNHFRNIEDLSKSLDDLSNSMDELKDILKKMIRPWLTSLLNWICVYAQGIS